MKVTIIYGNMRRSSTYNVVKSLLNHVTQLTNIEKTEFFLPKDMPSFCVGCFNCFLKSEQKCPHYEEVNKVITAIDECDLVIVASPVYVYDVSGQLKTLLDHLGYQWLPHRPKESMFNKMGVAISTTAGSGLKHTLKTIEHSFNFWGIARIYKYGVVVRASKWDEVTLDRRKKINDDMSKLAKNIYSQHVKKSITPSLKVKLYYQLFKKLHSKNKMTQIDHQYWQDKGWLDDHKPY